MPVVHCLKWEESEDYGKMVRPDGYSLHLTIQDCKLFITKHWSNHYSQKVPSCYSRPLGNSYPIEVDKDVYEKVKKAAYGLRLHGPAPASS